jgi:hypothetical protein
VAQRGVVDGEDGKRGAVGPQWRDFASAPYRARL